VDVRSLDEKVECGCGREFIFDIRRLFLFGTEDLKWMMRCRKLNSVCVELINLRRPYQSGQLLVDMIQHK